MYSMYYVHTQAKPCSCKDCYTTGKPNVLNVDIGINKQYLSSRERKLFNKLIKTRTAYDDIRNKILTDGKNEVYEKYSNVYNRSSTPDNVTNVYSIHDLVCKVDRGEFSPQHSGTSLSNKCCLCCSCTSKVRLKPKSHMNSIYSKNENQHLKTRKRNTKQSIESDSGTAMKSISVENKLDKLRQQAYRKPNGLHLKKGKIRKSFITKRVICQCISSDKKITNNIDKRLPLSATALKKRLHAENNSKGFFREEYKNMSDKSLRNHYLQNSEEDIQHNNTYKPRVSLTRKFTRVLCKCRHQKKPTRSKPSASSIKTIFGYKPRTRKHVGRDKLFLKPLPFPRECLTNMCQPGYCEPQKCTEILLNKSLPAHELKRCLCTLKLKKKTKQHPHSSLLTVNTNVNSYANARRTKNKKMECVCNIFPYRDSVSNKTNTRRQVSKKHKSHFDKHGTHLHPKKCFCTLKFQKKGTQNKIHQKSTKSISSVTNYIESETNSVYSSDVKTSIDNSKNQLLNYLYHPLLSEKKLLPYECEPYFCTPDQCDPYVCDKRIKLGNRISTSDDKSNLISENKAIYRYDVDTPITYDKIYTPKKTKRRDTENNLENYFEKTIKSRDKLMKQILLPTISDTNKRNSNFYPKKGAHTRNNNFPLEPLQYVENSNKAVSLDLLPYECEPNFCIPGNCNPYKCEKRIQTRKLLQRCFCTLKLQKHRDSNVKKYSVSSLTSTTSKFDLPEKRPKKEKKVKKVKRIICECYKRLKSVNEKQFNEADNRTKSHLPSISKSYTSRSSSFTSQRGSKTMTRKPSKTKHVECACYIESREKEPGIISTPSTVIKSVETLFEPPKVLKDSQNNPRNSLKQQQYPPKKYQSSPKIDSSPVDANKNLLNTSYKRLVKIESNFCIEIGFIKHLKPLDGKLKNNVTDKKVDNQVVSYDEKYKRQVKHRQVGGNKPYRYEKTIRNSVASKNSLKKPLNGSSLDSLRPIQAKPKRHKELAKDLDILKKPSQDKATYTRKEKQITQIKPIANTKPLNKSIAANFPNLLPYECEPNFCVPGQCNPYECKRRIQTRPFLKRCFCTLAFQRSDAFTNTKRISTARSISTKTMTRDRDLNNSKENIGTNAKKLHIKRAICECYIDKKITSKRSVNVRNASVNWENGILPDAIEKETVFKIKKNSIQLYKEKLKKERSKTKQIKMNPPNKLKSFEEPSLTEVKFKKSIVLIDRATAPERHKMISQSVSNTPPRSIGTKAPKQRKNKLKPPKEESLHSIKSKSFPNAPEKQTTPDKNTTKPVHKLSRCFCTLQLKKKPLKSAAKVSNVGDKYVLRNISIGNGKSTTQVIKISPKRARKISAVTANVDDLKNNQYLLPNECEPGVCTPYTCNPLECQKVIDKRIEPPKAKDKNKNNNKDKNKDNNKDKNKDKNKDQDKDKEVNVKKNKKTNYNPTPPVPTENKNKKEIVKQISVREVRNSQRVSQIPKYEKVQRKSNGIINKPLRSLKFSSEISFSIQLSKHNPNKQTANYRTIGNRKLSRNVSNKIR